MRYVQALTRYQRQLQADGCSAHTRAAYQRDLRALSRWLGGDPALGKITSDHLARFLASDEALQTPDGHPRAAITVNRTKSALRSFFAFCVASGWIKENPARLIRSTPARPKEPTTLEPGEIERLRAVLAAKRGTLAARDRLILEVLLGTGIRIGSLVGLNTGDIDLQSGTLRIHAKGGGEERVFLNPRLVVMLGGFLRESRTQGPCGPHSPLIRSRSGQAPRRPGDPAQVRLLGRISRHRPPRLRPLPPPHLRHPALPEDRRPVPGSAGAGAQADHDYGDLRQGVR